MAALVDTNVLVYRYDARYPAKQARAREILRRGIDQGTLRVPHQALLEFVAATTRIPRDGAAILSPTEAFREADEMLSVLPIVYPDEHVLRTAMRGVTTYGLSWFDAHLWAYAECEGLPEILSEDFQHGRLYGSVLCVNPFDDLK